MINELVGQTLTSVTVTENNERITFVTDSGTYEMFHSQDCCEQVYVEDIVGDLSDLLNSPVVMAEESSSSNDNSLGESVAGPHDDSFTWTFYRIQTAKGLVTIRWYGSSNGYYSESVDFEKV